MLDCEDILKIIGIIGLIVLGLFFGYWLWGIIAVDIFKLPELTFLQFIGLKILMGILFGGKVKVNKE